MTRLDEILNRIDESANAILSQKDISDDYFDSINGVMDSLFILI